MAVYGVSLLGVSVYKKYVTKTSSDLAHKTMTAQNLGAGRVHVLMLMKCSHNEC